MSKILEVHEKKGTDDAMTFSVSKKHLTDVPVLEQRKYLNDICFERIDEFEVPLLKI